jgi:Rrf2 family protein
VRTTARADYAVRAAIELAAAGGLVNAEQIADAQDIPVNFLENILRDLRQAGTVESRRGRAVEGPLATCAGCSRRSRSPTSHAANCRRTSRS